MTRHAVVALAVLALAGTGVVAGCAAAPDAQTRDEIVGPDRVSFPVVSGYLEHGCGSLDCHGQIGRNLRLHGYEGWRLDPADLPGGNPTTPDEVETNYRSVVGLEPEVMKAVEDDAGARPERLTLIAKARGIEKHKGLAVMKAGDAADRCLTSWLAGVTDATACTAALETP